MLNYVVQEVLIVFKIMEHHKINKLELLSSHTVWICGSVKRIINTFEKKIVYERQGVVKAKEHYD